MATPLDEIFPSKVVLYLQSKVMDVSADRQRACIVQWRLGFGDGRLRVQKFRDLLVVGRAGVIHEDMAWHAHGKRCVGVH